MQTDPVPLDRARRMRREPTEAEARLWRHLRDRQLLHTKFSRQVPIGSHIADFVARSAKLIVEIDGDSHADPSPDACRTALLEKRGYRVIRFSNVDVMSNLDGVCHAIGAALAAAANSAGESA